MKLFLFLSAVLFISSCEGLPVRSVPSVPSTSPPIVLQTSQKVEKFIDDIGKSLTKEHDYALNLVRGQQAISLTKKKRLDSLSGEFQLLGARLTNITAVYTQYKRQRDSALSDYDLFLSHYKKLESHINKTSVDYANELKFLTEIKAYIKKVKSSSCILK